MFTKEQLEGKSPEQIIEMTNAEVAIKEAEVIKAKSDLEYQKGESQKAFAKRDELKEEIRLLKEGKIDDATKKEITRLESLVNEQSNKISGFENEINTLKPKLQTLESEKVDLENTTKEELISSLPESKREFAKTLTDIKQLKNFVNLEGNSKNKSDEHRNITPDFFKNKNWNDLTYPEKVELKKLNPTLYRNLYESRNNK